MQQCVLIYDDDIEILKVCRVILELQNYQVETLSNCNSVIEDISMIKPDIILMDLWIPEAGGENAIKTIHENSSTKHIPVILFSANDQIEIISKRVNATGFLKKPFDILALREIIKNSLP
ncbi:MAG: response regulator [Ginsengibacter sp.]